MPQQGATRRLSQLFSMQPSPSTRARAAAQLSPLENDVILSMHPSSLNVVAPTDGWAENKSMDCWSATNE